MMMVEINVMTYVFSLRSEINRQLIFTTFTTFMDPYMAQLRLIKCLISGHEDSGAKIGPPGHVLVLGILHVYSEVQPSII